MVFHIIAIDTSASPTHLLNSRRNVAFDANVSLFFQPLSMGIVPMGKGHCARNYECSSLPSRLSIFFSFSRK